MAGQEAGGWKKLETEQCDLKHEIFGEPRVRAAGGGRQVSGRAGSVSFHKRVHPLTS